MLETHCTNATCTEVDVAKEVVDDLLPGVAIVCGACGAPTTEPAQTNVAAGTKVQ